MKQKNKILLIFAVFSLILSLTLLSKDKKSSANFKTLQMEEVKSSNTMEKMIADEAEIKRNIALVNSEPKKSKNSGRSKLSSQNSIINQLNEMKGEFYWSPDIYGIVEKEFKGNSKDQIGKHQDLIFVRSPAKINGAHNVIYNPNNKKLGLFLEKVIIVHDKSELLEEYLTKETGTAPDFHQGLYFINVSNFADAIDLGVKIKNNFSKSRVSPDISYGRVSPN